MRKAKIVDTIGPATESLEKITELVEAGMDVARLNRSHGTPEDHLRVYNNVREASKTTGRNVAVLVDLQGRRSAAVGSRRTPKAKTRSSSKRAIIHHHHR